MPRAAERATNAAVEKVIGQQTAVGYLKKQSGQDRYNGDNQFEWADETYYNPVDIGGLEQVRGPRWVWV